MAIAKDKLEGQIKLAFPAAEIKIVDLLGDQDHYSVEITAQEFSGLSRIQQHQLVYKALGETMKEELHALSIKTLVPEGEK